MQLDSCVYPDLATKYSVFPNGMQCFPVGYHKCHVFPNGIHRDAVKKILILNPNDFFSRHFKNLNGQKLDNLFIFQVLKFCGDSSI